MSWGDSFINGYTAVTDAKNKKKSLEQADRLAQADQALRKEMQDKQLASDMDRLKSEQGARRQDRLESEFHDTMEKQSDRDFRGGQSDKDRSFQKGMAGDQRGWQGGENDKNRSLTQQEIDNRLRGDLLQAGFQSRRLDMEEPEAAARAKYYNEGGPRGSGLGGFTTTEGWGKDELGNDIKIKSRIPTGSFGANNWKLGSAQPTEAAAPAPTGAPAASAAPTAAQTPSVGSRAFGALQAAGKSIGSTGAFGSAYNAVKNANKPPQSAIDALRANPALKAQFESKYGEGSSTQYSQ